MKRRMSLKSAYAILGGTSLLLATQVRAEPTDGNFPDKTTIKKPEPVVGPRNYYLTIDDSPACDTGQVLDFLKANKITAIFFCRGDQLERYPDTMVRAVKDGHILGNHTYSHPRCSSLSLDEIKNEIEKTEILIDATYRAAGVERPGEFVRFPHLDDAHEKFPALDQWLVDQGFRHPSLPGAGAKFGDIGPGCPTQLGQTLDTGDWAVTPDAWRKEYGNPTFDGTVIATNEDLAKHIASMHEVLDPKQTGVLLTHSQPRDDNPDTGNADVFLSEMKVMLAMGIKFIPPKEGYVVSNALKVAAGAPRPG